MKSILKTAQLILKERAMDKQISKLREQRAALRNGHVRSYGLSHSDGRQDLTFELPLGEYLTTFADKEPKAKALSFPREEEIDGVKMAGTKHYMRYPAQWVGTLPTNPPTHLWVEATTDTAWAVGDPKPVLAQAV